MTILILAHVASICLCAAAELEALSAVAKDKGISIATARRLERERDLTPELLGRLNSNTLARAIRRLNTPDLPQQREVFRKMQERDESKRIPTGAKQRARQQLENLRTVEKTSAAGLPTGYLRTASKLLPFAENSLELRTNTHALKAGAWVALGPSNVGGRTRSIVIDPDEPTTMWCASVGGGIWESRNEGQTFSPVDDAMANLAVSCLVMDPHDHKTLYAGTGEGYYNIDAIRGAGIFVTKDRITWKQLAGTSGTNFYNVNRLTVSQSGTILLAATLNGIYRSEDSTHSTWSSVWEGEIGMVLFAPNSDSRAVAGTLKGGALYTTDGGLTWTVADGTQDWCGRVELTYAAADPSIVYASVAMGSGEIWRSSDYGGSFTRQKCLTADDIPVSYLGTQGWYDNAIWAGDPLDADLVLVGGIDLWRSTNGGNYLTQISQWQNPSSAHADQHAIVGAPNYSTNNRSVYFGNDGGIYRCLDVLTVGQDSECSSGWAKLGDGYTVTQFYAGCGNSENIIIGGAQDCGTVCYCPSNGTRWTLVNGGDGGWCAADEKDHNYFYGEYINLDIFRSSDGGKTVEDLSGAYYNGSRWAWRTTPYLIPDARDRTALFIAPFVLDPSDNNRIYAGGMSLWRTDDARAQVTDQIGPQWRSVKDPINQAISAIAVAPGEPQVLFVGHEDGEVFKTTNALSSTIAWTPVGASGAAQLPRRYCTRIVFDPKNRNTIYIAFGGFSKGNLYKSVDAGTIWKSIGATLPEAPIRAIAVHPKTNSRVYVGTEVGLFATEDSGQTWLPTSEGPTSCSVDDLFWIQTKLTAATHGRGMFQIEIP